MSQPYEYAKVRTGNYENISLTCPTLTINGSLVVTVNINALTFVSTNIITTNVTTTNITTTSITTTNLILTTSGVATFGTAGTMNFVKEVDNGAIGPFALNGNATQQGTLVYTSNTFASTGAIIQASAAIVSCKKFGHFIDIDIDPLTGLSTPSGATANTITLTGAIPAGYRPTRNSFYPCLVHNNAANTIGVVGLLASGDITFYATAALGNFTNAANGGVPGRTSINYVKN